MRSGKLYFKMRLLPQQLATADGCGLSTCSTTTSAQGEQMLPSLTHPEGKANHLAQFNSARTITIGLLMGLFLLSGCSPSSKTNSSNQLVEENDSGSIASCQIPFEKGGRVVSASAVPLTLTQGPFGKRYASAALLALGDASGLETIRFVREFGVDLIRGASSQGCSFFGSLPTGSSQHQRFWETQATKAENRLLGLYLPLENGASDAPSIALPTIFLRENSDRYTLVHEYMHHLFSTTRRQETGLSDAYVKSELIRLLKELQSRGDWISRTSSAQQISSFTTAFVEFNSKLTELVLRFPLEEIAIEHVLGQAYSQGSLRNVARISFDAGGSYMRSSLKNVEEFLGVPTKISEEIDRALGCSSNTCPGSNAETQAALQAWTRAKNQVETANSELLREARRIVSANRSRALGMDPSSFLALEPAAHGGVLHEDKPHTHNGIPCGRSREALLILKNLQQP